MFQSPRSGKFESNFGKYFNALPDYQRFNPLDRGNLNQIQKAELSDDVVYAFQSPRSGKFESNMILI